MVYFQALRYHILDLVLLVETKFNLEVGGLENFETPYFSSL